MKIKACDEDDVQQRFDYEEVSGRLVYRDNKRLCVNYQMNDDGAVEKVALTASKCYGVSFQNLVEAVEPTTLKPTTVEPTTLESTTLEPTTLEPTTIEPSPPQPTTGCPFATSKPDTTNPPTTTPQTVKPTTTPVATQKTQTPPPTEPETPEGWLPALAHENLALTIVRHQIHQENKRRASEPHSVTVTKDIEAKIIQLAFHMNQGKSDGCIDLYSAFNNFSPTLKISFFLPKLF